ncbi:MAG: TonB-dependent siderophore receptor [Capnocytophaga sp.]|nr:TonB-dependent siderophore receptor [Capnocytophaga sp.]
MKTKLLILLALGSSLGIYAQDEPIKLEGVEVKASKKAKVTENVSSSLRLQTPLIAIPQNIQEIIREDLDAQIVLSLSDGLLRNVSGATRLEHWGDSYARVNMRGSRAAAFLNGVNVTTTWGPLTEDMSYVERVEFVKGPAGFMMANGEPSGIYNIVLKQPTGRDTNGSVRFTTGSFDLYRGEADIDSKITGKLSFRINLMGQEGNSFRNYDYNNRYIAAPSLRYELDEKTTLTAQYIYQKVKMANIGTAYVFSTEGYKTFPREFSLGDPKLEPSKMDDHTLNVNLQHRFSDDWKLTSQLSYFENITEGSSLWIKGTPTATSLVRYVSIFDAVNKMKFAQVFLNGKFQTGKISHTILTGLDAGLKNYVADWSQAHDLDTAAAPFDLTVTAYQAPSNGYPEFNRSTPLEERPGASRIQQRYTGLYFQDELGFFNNQLRLTLATRYTDAANDNYGRVSKASRWTPRIGLSFLFDENTSVYSLFDQAFVPQAGILRNGGNIKPITGNNMEIGMKKDFFNKRWNATASVYQIEKNNQLTTDPANAAGEAYSIVMGQSKAKGVELDVKGQITASLRVILNYAFTENTITKSNTPNINVGDRIAGYAKHTANTWISYEFLDGKLRGAGLSLGGTFLGDRSSWNWNGSGQQKMDDYKKVDGGIFWSNEKLHVVLNIYNMFDEYLYSGSPYNSYYYYQAEAPRNWRLSVAYKF